MTFTQDSQVTLLADLNNYVNDNFAGIGSTLQIPGYSYDYDVLQKVDMPSTGFQAVVLQRQGSSEKTVVFCGSAPPEWGSSFSELINDWLDTDAKMVRGEVPDQYADAYLLVHNLLQNTQNNVTITGYSLGGGLAQLVGGALSVLYSNINVIGFNAPGVKAVLSQLNIPENLVNESLIKNYINMNDLLGNINGVDGRIGSTYFMPLVDGISDINNTHTVYYNNNSFISLNNFDYKEAAALWYYDKYNTFFSTKKTSENITLLGVNILNVTEADFFRAVEIVKGLGVPDHTLWYRTTQGDYIIDDNAGTNPLTGTNPILSPVGCARRTT